MEGPDPMTGPMEREGNLDALTQRYRDGVGESIT